MGTENTNTKDEVISEEFLNKISTELQASAEENEKLKRIRELLNSTNTVEQFDPDDSSINTANAADFDLLEKEAEELPTVNLIDIAIDGIKSGDINVDQISDNCKDIFPGCSKDDIIQVINIAKRYKDGEDFSIFGAMPDNLKKIIRLQAGTLNKSDINLCAKMLIEEFCTEVFSVTMEKECIDFNAAIKEALSIPDITTLYTEHIKEKMEVDLINKADALQEEFPNAAKVLRDCSAAFTDSHTFSKMREAIKGKVKRKLYKDNDFYNRYCNEFNTKNEKSKFKINDIFEVGRVLSLLSPVIGIDDEDIKMFVILLCKTCSNMDSNNTADGIFMYYSIRNILNMEHHDLLSPISKKPDGFDADVISNIQSLIKDIHMIVDERR